MSADLKLSPQQENEAEAHVLARMRMGASFKYRDLYLYADSKLGIGGWGQPSTYRLADRLIQRERKAGRIEQTATRGMWRIVKTEAR